jgi:hypothetical protein
LDKASTTHHYFASSSSTAITMGVFSKHYHTVESVWDKYLQKHFMTPLRGMGVHLGAGKSTSVMKKHIGLERLVAISPNEILEPDLALQGVNHVQAETNSDKAAAALAKHGGPIQVIVCDDTSDVNQALTAITALMKKLEQRMFFSSDPMFTLPAACIVTFRTSKIKRKQVGNDLQGEIAGMLQRLACLVYGDSSNMVRIRHQIIPVSSNGDYILAAVFDNKTIVD